MKVTNPILKGFHPDPCILRVNDDYYIATSTFQWFPGVEIYHSKDLVNWELSPSPLSKTTQLDLAGVPNSCGVWAPCLSYCDGTFYLIYTVVRDFQRKFIDLKNYLVTTTDICGEWSDPIYLNSSGFDPSLFHDDDGRKYLVNMLADFRDGKSLFGGILLQEYSTTEKKLVGKPVNIYKGTSVGITESPHLYKKRRILLSHGCRRRHSVRPRHTTCSLQEPFGALRKRPRTAFNDQTFPGFSVATNRTFLAC